MIAIKRVGTAVRIEIQSGLCVPKPVYPFHWETNDENNAELLAAHLNKCLYNAVQEARKESYDKGYKHGRGKFKKEDWHWGGLR